MRRLGFDLAGMVAAVASIGTAAVAQEPGSRATREFVQAAAQSDAFEMMAATTALAESKDARVLAFAQEMLRAHRQTTDALMAAVTKAGLKPPRPGLNGDQSMFLAQLQSERGAAFDPAYLHQQLLAHRAALAMAQGYAASGDDATIKSTAAALVTVIAAHVSMLEQMQPEG